ncbi:outer membrane lipid asymmetry maintenance protein MlaD [Sulfuriferula nivalis]|uniref:Outer membrane lipid asymmetry maintenance protein MlaD n=1 Tax=Sulfuriferula nivalis TaxID=2675298 RepID=A0A809RH04_9PROT|nr:outer membrane lipid asymmetry maintenance protein MlaD [Sulfuriferula nivalis]BBP00845.1 outer membrane lipid asymmetry maintenance protein MlaD [Sulfuriferula nivalis]
MERAKLDFWVGLFVLAGFAALLGLALKVGNMTSFSTAQTYLVNADFSNIGSLKVRAPVKSAGVVVGRVSDIRFDNQNFEATVTLKLDAKYQFPKDTSAAIMTSGLLGEQFVALDAGGDVKNLITGDKIKITQSAVVLENLISQFLYNKASDAPKTDAAQKSTQGMQP